MNGNGSDPASLERMLQRVGALWRHGGDATEAHALLASGMHSNAYVDCTPITCSPELTRRAMGGVTGRALGYLAQRGIWSGEPFWAIGPYAGAVHLAYAVAGIRGRGCRAAWAERTRRGAKKRIIPERFAADMRGEYALIVEDVFTTGESARQTAEAARRCGAQVLPAFISIVKRSGHQAVGGWPIFSALVESALELEAQEWRPKECPLCKRGSRALPPKSHRSAFAQTVQTERKPT